MSVPVHSHELTLSLGQWGQVAWRKRIGGGECKGREEQKKIKRREREGVRKERKEEEKRREMRREMRRKVKRWYSEWKGRWEEGGKMRKRGGRKENQIE